MFQQADRMNGLTPEIFNSMNEMNKTATANGVDVIQLGFGSPDLTPPLHIMKSMELDQLTLIIMGILEQKEVLNY